QENKELRRILYCRRCRRQHRSCLFLPCRHLLYCFDCGELFRYCEVCREFIMQRLHVII
uniref:RING-type domain-containing protein n=1 Tax=Magallana gigas TaxID=29159 RepID=A0A8W8KZJ6_MAGGI